MNGSSGLCVLATAPYLPRNPCMEQRTMSASCTTASFWLGSSAPTEFRTMRRLPTKFQRIGPASTPNWRVHSARVSSHRGMLRRVPRCSSGKLDLPDSPDDPGEWVGSKTGIGAVYMEKADDEWSKLPPLKSARRTKIICTISPRISDAASLERLIDEGMNVARFNMSHMDRTWFKNTVSIIKDINERNGWSVGVMVDTEGSELHIGDLESANVDVAEDEEWVFTVRHQAEYEDRTVEVNYDGFTDDIQIGDSILVDGGMARFEVIDKTGPDVRCVCLDGGNMLSRSNLTLRRGGKLVRSRNALLPTLTKKDWSDIHFALECEVDFICVSFVKSPEAILDLKSYLDSNSKATLNRPAVIAKLESYECIDSIPDIIEAADGAMVARGDLGAQIAMEDVPSVQTEIVARCRALGRPVIVASHLLESMIKFPTPTRAEVADIAEAVKQRTDALMLSGETAAGLYPLKALTVLDQVCLRFERLDEEKGMVSATIKEYDENVPFPVSSEICMSAASMADRLKADAIIVFTRRGYMASLLSQRRPKCPIYAFTNTTRIRRRLNLLWGVISTDLQFSSNPEATIRRSFEYLQSRKKILPGMKVIVVSDMMVPASSTDPSKSAGEQLVHTVQIRTVPAEGPAREGPSITRGDGVAEIPRWMQSAEEAKNADKSKKSKKGKKSSKVKKGKKESL